MGEPLSSRQLLHNSYHLSIRSSLLAIQSTLSLQKTMLQSDHSTMVDIKSVIASQNTTLQRITKTLAETFSKISSYKPLSLPQPRAATPPAVPSGSHPLTAPATITAAEPISVAAPTIPTIITLPSLNSPLPTVLKSSLPSTQHSGCSALSSINKQSRSSPSPLAPSHSPKEDPRTMNFSPKSPKSPHILAVAARSISRPSPTPPPMNSPPRYPVCVPAKNNVHYQSDAYYSTAAVYKVLCATLAQNSSRHIAQKENGAHNVFVEMSKLELEWTNAPSVFAEINKLRCERKILIFDPGGTFNLKDTFDLEDKVVFEELVMIRLQSSMTRSTLCTCQAHQAKTYDHDKLGAARSK